MTCTCEGPPSQFAPAGYRGTPYSGPYMGRLRPNGLKEIAILLHERVTKSAAKWKKWWLKRSILKGAKVWQK